MPTQEAPIEISQIYQPQRGFRARFFAIRLALAGLPIAAVGSPLFDSFTPAADAQAQGVICNRVGMLIDYQYYFDGGGETFPDGKAKFTDPAKDPTSKDRIVRKAPDRQLEVFNPSTNRAIKVKTGANGTALADFRNLPSDKNVQVRINGVLQGVAGVDLRVRDIPDDPKDLALPGADPLQDSLDSIDPSDVPCDKIEPVQVYSPITDQQEQALQRKYGQPSTPSTPAAFEVVRTPAPTRSTSGQATPVVSGTSALPGATRTPLTNSSPDARPAVVATVIVTNTPDAAAVASATTVVQQRDAAWAELNNLRPTSTIAAQQRDAAWDELNQLRPTATAAATLVPGLTGELNIARQTATAVGTPIAQLEQERDEARTREEAYVDLPLLRRIYYHYPLIGALALATLLAGGVALYQRRRRNEIEEVADNTAVYATNLAQQRDAADNETNLAIDQLDQTNIALDQTLEELADTQTELTNAIVVRDDALDERDTAVTAVVELDEAIHLHEATNGDIVTHPHP